MIARGAPVGAVCLRCRLRLLHQLTPIRSVTSDATATHHVHDRGDGDGDGANQDRTHRSKGKLRTKRLDLRKKHLSGNRVLNEASASLGAAMLGKPAYAIVMRDGGVVQRNQAELPSDAGEHTSQHLAAKIEALIESQREPLTLTEVRSNIDDLRPQLERTLSEKDFRRLQHLLTEGFLSKQLQDYINWHKANTKRKSKEKTADESSHPLFPWIQDMSPWAPLGTQPGIVDSVDPTLQGYLSDTAPVKERLAVRLMRECWDLSIVELATQLGETHVQLRDFEFALLMRGTQRFMNTLGKGWLEPGEKIEAFRNEKTLRLVTTRPKVDSLLKDLNETLKCVTTMTFPINLIGWEALDDTILEEVGRITNTHVRKSHTLRRLHVTWIELKARANRGLTFVEDMSHVVFRLLLTASGSQQTTTALLSPALTRDSGGRLIIDVTSKEKLTWKDRLAQWARYVLPLTPQGSAATAELPIKTLELPFEPLGHISETKSPFPPVRWSKVPCTSTIAHFGQVLHPYQSTNPTPPLSDLLACSNKHIFSPTTPHPLHLSNFEANSYNGSPLLVPTKSTLVLRFWPSPSSNPISTPRPGGTEQSQKASSRAADAPQAPILEFRLATSDREVEGIESVRAITRTHHTDVMLPSSLVDLRFTQTQYETLEAHNRAALAAWQPAADFLKHARLDLAMGKLEMPPRQRFPIPRRLVNTGPSSTVSSSDSPPPSSPTSPVNPTTTQDNDNSTANYSELQETVEEDVISVSYEFVGLELHRSATLPYEGHKLTYTSIEAGQGGGRRAEVTLEPVRPADSTPPPSALVTDGIDQNKLQEDFLVCCSRFAANRSLWSGFVVDKHRF
ncbi:hypothetical protein F5Y19DRAFT_326625 [Xylariaceae sp. FL1651]|nr:hypothetical protein F5Y19DRAFT_326625 [Xylariaceae sp. FL1651]